MNLTVLTVKQLNTYVRSLLEGDINLASVCVSGEIINLKIYSSGHLYFSLRDSDNLVKCVMFCSNASKLKFSPTDGLKIICKGKVTLYEKDGTYQLVCETMFEDDQGDISLKYKQIKEKLEKEGLFLQKFKKPLVDFPRQIAVVTSRDGAAMHDIISVLNRRYPLCKLLIFHAQVQGQGAEKSLLNAYNLAKASDSDTIIIARGGGSKEDLEAFNDENLARSVFSSKIPTVSAIGHETDFSILDFVADLRAPTPTAAAELSTPNIEDIISFLNNKSLILKNNYNFYLDNFKNRLNIIEKSKVFLEPGYIYKNYENEFDKKISSFVNTYKNYLSINELKTSNLASRLKLLNPLNILARGYSLIFKNGKTVKNIDDINENDELTINIYNKKIELTATNVKKVES